MHWRTKPILRVKELADDMHRTGYARQVHYCTAITAVCWLTFAALLMIADVGVAGDQADATAPTADQIAFFETEVRPLLAAKCYECHGTEKQRGGLRLDSRAAMLEGGESGAVLEPGYPEQSLLIAAVNYEGLEMPPSGPLSEAEIERLSRWITMGAPWPGTQPAMREQPALPKITDEDRAWWSFQPLAQVAPPSIADPWVQSPLDAFVYERLEQAGLRPAAPADRRTLARRVYFDLWGLPPTAEQLDEFVNDPRPDAFARLVDRLLDHPNYGQRWARHWLDLVRYAESDGYKQDDYRPEAWRYRDYVIRSLNADKPYNRFVVEQLAGDELDSQNIEYMTATGLLRHTIYEYNQRDVRTQWEFMVGEVTEVTADVFLAMGLACARCHDHKFDPLLQSDYFHFRAFFEPMLPRDDLMMGTPAELEVYRAQQAEWLEATKDIRAAIDDLERSVRESAIRAAIAKFPKDIRPLLERPADARTPKEQQLAELAARQITAEIANVGQRLSGEAKEKWKALQARLAEFDHLKPKPLPASFAVTDVGPIAPPTTIPDARQPKEFEPALFEVLNAEPFPIEPPSPSSNSTGRRLALARWIADANNPLSTRVIVNRVWQYHFGEGLVRTSSDFGRLGERPSHPELLDWLTREFLQDGWSLKSLHRRIMNSATYQQSSQPVDPALAMQVDPENRLLSHAPVRRLDAEQVRDAMLLVTGQLVERGGGPSLELDAPVRSVFTRAMRNTRDPLLDVFDAPDGFTSAPKRNVTTTPTQALLMLNSDATLSHARALASQIAAQSTDPVGQIAAAYRRVLSRAPTAEELSAGQRLLALAALATPKTESAAENKASEGLIDLCHVLLNTSEFLYVE